MNEKELFYHFLLRKISPGTLRTSGTAKMR